MNALGQLDQAFQAVKLFADQFSGSQEIRSMLVELLRACSREEEAREQLEKMAVDLEAMGDKAGARKTRERLHASETGHPACPGRCPGHRLRAARGDLIFLDTGFDSDAPPAARPPGSGQPVRGRHRLLVVAATPPSPSRSAERTMRHLQRRRP